MFATANIRNQNALKNEKNQYFYSQRKSLFSCEFFEWFIYVCALLCFTALGIDFLFTEFSFCCCSSWDVWFWLTSAKQLSEAPSYLCREMKKTTVAFTVLKRNVWVNTALEENHWFFSLPVNLHSSIYPKDRGAFPVSLATTKHKTAYACLCKATERYRPVWGTEYGTIHMQEDIQSHCEKTSMCIMALLTYPWEGCSLQHFIHLA